jgi:hypothetical protein
MQEYVQFKHKHNKTFSVEEEVQKLSTFLQTYKDVKDHNENHYAKGNATFHKGINAFSAEGKEEFSAKHHGFVHHKNISFHNHSHNRTTPWINNNTGNESESDGEDRVLATASKSKTTTVSTSVGCTAPAAVTCNAANLAQALSCPTGLYVSSGSCAS